MNVTRSLHGLGTFNEIVDITPSYQVGMYLSRYNVPFTSVDLG